MKKVTKPQIMRDLRELKKQAVEELEKANSVKVEEYKRACVEKYRDKIEELVKEIAPIATKVNSLVQELSSDENLHYGTYSSSNIYLHLTHGADSTVNYILYNANWYRGKLEVFKQKLKEEEYALEREWGKLIVYAQNLDIRALRKYLEDNNIELPCMSEEVEETSLVQIDVNLSMLFGDKSSK